jgi:hypothetical protein
MSLTVTQSKYNSANAQSTPIPNTAHMLPFSKKNFSSMSLSIATNNQIIPTMMRSPPIYGNTRHIPEPMNQVNVPKMLWGKPTWYLLHMLAEKIQDNKFQELRPQILNIIYSICNNLPCPTCATHAKEYLNKINLFHINTKEELKTMLFNFHNDVNNRKGYAPFSRQELDSLYTKADPIAIIQNFLISFNKKNKSIRLLADDLSRQNITNSLKTWFQQNIKYFDPPNSSGGYATL